MILYLITSNDKKFKEIENFFKDLPNLVLKRINLEVPEIQSIDVTEVAKFKLNYVKENYKIKNFIIEDTGVYLDCLKKLPGPFVKWFLEVGGVKLLYDICRFYNNYKLKAITSVGLRFKGREYFFNGSVKGRLIKPNANNKKWWDKIFMPEGYNVTFDKLTIEQKNLISPRGRAMKKLKKFLRNQIA